MKVPIRPDWWWNLHYICWIASTATADESYLREHILAPRARTVAGYQSIMPTYKALQMNDDQLAQIVAYIKSLREYKTDTEPKP